MTTIANRAVHDPFLQDADLQRRDTAEYRQAFNDYVRTGTFAATPAQFHIGGVQRRALHMGGTGAYLAPDAFERLVKLNMVDYSPMRKLATIIPTDTGNNLMLPIDSEETEGALLTAGGTATDTDPSQVGQQRMGAFLWTSGVVRASVELVTDAGATFDDYIARLLAARIARAQNRAYTIGAGPDTPQGVVWSATQGVVGAAGQTSSVTGDDVMNLEDALDPGFREGAVLMAHPSTITNLKRIKDGSGRYLWDPATKTLGGWPYVANVHMPTMTAGARSILLGRFDQYVVRDVAGLGLSVLVEPWAAQGQVGYIAFARGSGALVEAGSPAVVYYQNAES